MKDGWDKFKISSEALKNNWPILLMAATALSSGLGNISQHFDVQAKEAEKNQAIHDVAVGFHRVIAEIKPEDVKPKKVKKVDTGCNYCKAEINKLKEWHK